MAQHEYDKILFRLLTILRRLSEGEQLNKESLAQEFNVSTKTIQRDFNERLVVLFPIHKVGNSWKMMDGFTLEKTKVFEDVLILDILKTVSTGFGAQFASRTENLLGKLTDFSPSAFYTRVSFEDVSRLTALFDILEHAINDSVLVQFVHDHKYRYVKPYRIVNFDGYWYLLAEDVIHGKAKTFHIARMSNVQATKEHFEKDLSLQKSLDIAVNAWFNVDVQPFTVTLEVASSIRRFILDHPLAPTQRVVEEKEDGTLIIAFEITAEKEIIHTIQKWMPHIRVLSPKSLQESVINQVKLFLEKQILS